MNESPEITYIEFNGQWIREDEIIDYTKEQLDKINVSTEVFIKTLWDTIKQQKVDL